MKEFKECDVQPSASWDGRINADRTDLIYAPTEWQKRGLSETASGYGNRLNSGLKIRFEGRDYRVYVTIFSNCGTCWFQTKERKIIVDA